MQLSELTYRVGFRSFQEYQEYEESQERLAQKVNAYKADWMIDDGETDYAPDYKDTETGGV